MPGPLKIVLVGDNGVGKKHFIRTYHERKFPEVWQGIPEDPIFVPYGVPNATSVVLFYTNGSHDYNLRKNGWYETDVFVLFYSVSDPPSLNNLESVFWPEIKNYFPDVPIILVGTKIELRNDQETVDRLKSKRYQCVSVEEAICFAKKIGAVGYFECSSKLMLGLDEVLLAAVQIAQANKNIPKNSEKAKKQILKSALSRSFKIGKMETEFYCSFSHSFPSIYGHCAELVGEKIYLFSDDDQLRIFDPRKKSWETQKLPGLGQFCSSATINGDIFIFGGKKNGYSNDTFKFSTASKTLELLQTAGKPIPRYGHSSSIYKGEMYIFGGYDNLGMPCDDLYVLNTNELKWRKINVEKRPESRFMHTAVVIGEQMYIFGGLSHDSKSFNDLYAFNLEQQQWIKIKPKGKAPSARYGHSALLDCTGNMLIFGGCDKQKGTTFSDFFCINLQKDKEKEWRNIPVHGDITGSASGAAVWDDFTKSLWVFGGRDLDSAATGKMFALSEAYHNVIYKLPVELLLHICSMLPNKEIMRLKLACKKSFSVLEDPRLWYLMLRNLPPYAPLVIPSGTAKNSIYEFYANSKFKIHVPEVS